MELDLSVVTKANLKVGQTISNNQINVLKKQDDLCNALTIAVRYLSYRAQSEAEIRFKLKQRRFNNETIDNVIQQLREQHLVNDIAFAKHWKESRINDSPRSKKMLDMELKRKGISVETASSVTSDVNDLSNAYKAAHNRLKNLSSLDYQTFRNKLGSFLHRRGFSYSVIVTTVNKLWTEKKNNLSI